MEPSLSVVIVVPPEAQEIPSLSSLQRLEGVSQMIEIIVARGRMPSVQRNLAVERATGDWIWFLDNDSLVSLSTWQAVGAWIQREDVDVDVIGGPNLCPSDAPWVQRA
ncbi:MAG: glycosyltransferase, partial [Verrucomicrobiota bacterium]|nr:glycosyltransferase [Verrucomicrobiota bacterium]